MNKLIVWCSLATVFFTSCSNQSNKVKVDLILIDSIKTLSPTVTAQVVQVQGKYLLYTAGEGNELESHQVQQNGHLITGSSTKINDKIGGVRGLISSQIDNKDILIVGNKGESSIEVDQINENGELHQLSSVSDTDSTFLKQNITTALVNMDGNQFVFVGGMDPGLSCFQLSSDGTLTPIQSMADDSTMFLNGIIGMTSLVIDGKTYLFTGGFVDGGVSSFRVSNDGGFTNVDNIKDNEKLFLTGAYPLNSVQLGNRNYLIVGHRHKIHYPAYKNEKKLIYHGDGINVFEVNPQGKLTLSCLLKDNDQLNLKGSTRIEIIKISDEQAIVIIGSRDDKGIQIASLNSNGILSPIKEYDINYSIYNGMTIEQIGNQWYLFVGGYDKYIINSYLISIKN